MGKDGDLGIARIFGSSESLFGEADLVVYILRMNNWTNVYGVRVGVLMACGKRFISFCSRTGIYAVSKLETRIDGARFMF
jgi:hypothetical protein